MMHTLDLAVEFLDASTADLVGLILALTTAPPGPHPAVVDVVDLFPDDREGPLFAMHPWTGSHQELPLTIPQRRTLRELLDLYRWAHTDDAAEAVTQ